jgi:hypothetical protein
VWRDARGDCWLSGSLEGQGGTLLEEAGQPGVEGVGLDLTVEGGLLPAGASSAVVVDDAGVDRPAEAGGGAWVIVLEQRSFRTCPVRYLDDRGEPVRAPLPDDWRSEPVTDSSAACPACGASSWEKAVPADTESRGAQGTPDGGWEPTPIVVCTVCGHEERMPSFMRASDDDGWERDDDGPSFDPVMPAVGFPVYGVAGLEPKLGGWGASGLLTTEVYIAHGTREDDVWALVSTEHEDHPMDSEAASARAALENCLLDAGAQDWPLDLSDAALTLGLREEQVAVRRAAAVPAESLEIPVAGAPTEFQLVRSGGHWAAAARMHPDMLVTIAARGIEPSAVTLVPVPDPSALPHGD